MKAIYKDKLIELCQKVAGLLGKELLMVSISVVDEELAYYSCFAGGSIFSAVTFLGIFVNGKYVFFYSPAHTADEIISMVNVDRAKKTISGEATPEDRLYKIKI